MKQKKYFYPKAIQVTKTYLKIVCLFVILLLPIILKNNRVENFPSVFHFAGAILSLYFLLPIFCAFYIGSWPEIIVQDMGVEIEFLWTKHFVSFDEIVSVHQVGSNTFGVTVVKVKNQKLTLFHKVYSLFTIHSLGPSFYIHPNIHNYQSLINTISKNLTKP